MPSFSSQLVEIPGRYGKLNLSYWMTGAPIYSSRLGNWTFIMDPDQKKFASWAQLYSEVANYVHGRELRIVLTDDPDYYYIGTLAISGFSPQDISNEITITYELDPYKNPIGDPFITDWLWDPFNFETDMVYSTDAVTVDGTRIISFQGLNGYYSPAVKFTKAASDSTMVISYNGRNYPLVEGANYLHTLILDSGSHNLVFTGHGTVQLSYKGSVL
jgi:hypothetical protein